MPQSNSDLAEILVGRDPALYRDPNYKGPCEAIDPDKIQALAEDLLDLIANVVSTIIDAGSERDAVNENENLLHAIKLELNGWTAR